MRRERVLLLMHDTTDWPVAFLGSLYAGIVPVAVNTLLSADDYAYMIGHCRAQAALVSAPLLPILETALAKSTHGSHAGRIAAEVVATGRRDRVRRLPGEDARSETGATGTRRHGVLAVFVGLHRRPKGTCIRMRIRTGRSSCTASACSA